MSKPKSTPSKPKYREFHDIKLALPKVPELYKLRRVYWLLNNMHKLLEKEPAAIPVRSYLDLLSTYTAMVAEAQKKGLHTLEGRQNARARVDKQKLASDGEQDDAAGVGEALPFGLGSGIPADDKPSGSGADSA